VIDTKFKTISRRLVPLLYFLAVSLPHHPASALFDKDILIPVGFYSIQHIVDVISIAAIVGVFVLAIGVVRIHGRASAYHFCLWLSLLLLMYLADHYMNVNNAERIHYPQYAVLALLLGLTLRSEVLIFFVTSFAGFVDEFLQFVMAPDKTNYLDFNDIILNILGAAFGIALLLAFRKSAAPQSSKYENRLRAVFLTCMATGAFIVLSSLALGRIAPVMENMHPRSVIAIVEGKTSFIMSFERHDQFWQKSYFGKVFHIFSPLEGILAIAVLSALACLAINSLKPLRISPPVRQVDHNDI
jgi:hypothetical protein